MTKVQKRIVLQVFPNPIIREWHTTHRINAVEGICNAVECRSGRDPQANEFMGARSTPENSPKAFALARAISMIQGVKEVKVQVHSVRVEIYEAFNFDDDKIAENVTREVQRHVYSLRQKVQIIDHRGNQSAISYRENPPADDLRDLDSLGDLSTDL